MFTRSRSRERMGAVATRRWRPAFALIALLAVFLQAFVVQTHVHAIGAPLSIGYQQPAAAHDDAAHAMATTEHQLVCAICQALATSGTATLPASTVALIAEQSSTLALVALALAPQTISHFWQSRAPPSFL